MRECMRVHVSMSDRERESVCVCSVLQLKEVIGYVSTRCELV